MSTFARETLCRIWQITRRDGLRLGFTDHDRDLEFAGLMCRAGSGLTASALVKSAGLSVDNAEAAGALSDAAIREEDLTAGRFDGAEIAIWLVDWQDLSQAEPLFNGTLGEITRHGLSFRCELRGLSEALSQPIGHAYTRSCSAVLGDARCGFDLRQPGYLLELPVEEVDAAGRLFRLRIEEEYPPGWFTTGRLKMISGAAAGLEAMIQSDRLVPGGREIGLWQSIRAEIRPGDHLELSPGCDRRAVTCRQKFNNLKNFRGFPHLPSEDWLTSWPRQGQGNAGGSLFLSSGPGEGL